VAGCPQREPLFDSRQLEDLSAAGVSRAYLTAQMTLSLAGFTKGTNRAVTCHRRFGRKTQWTQIAKAQGAKHAISPRLTIRRRNSTLLGFDEVIALSVEKLSDGVRRITEGYGADIVIDAMGGEILRRSSRHNSLSGEV